MPYSALQARGHWFEPSCAHQISQAADRLKVAADFALLAASVNLARLAVLGLASCGGTWVASTG